MGYVVEARHITLDERVALKFLLPEYAKHPEATARFLREARAAVKIKSEHVARVSDVGTLENGAPYMVIEFLDGADLANTLEKKGVLAIDDAIDYILQASEAIAEAHSYGIVHRDLKPANLFLAKRPDGSPLVKVLDFGISKVVGAGDHALTKTSTAMGSALYMSPEQMLETRGVDHRTDIYSMGVALFELLAGRQPFYAEALPQLCAEVLTGTPRPMSAFRSDVPPALAAVIEHAYERDKNNRYQSISEFALALAPFAPERSRATIERLARMGKLPAPPRMRAEATSSSGIQVPVPAPIVVTSATLPMPSVSAAALAETATKDELPTAAVEQLPPIPDTAPLSELRIEPGSYRAPISTNAAAAFASATKTDRRSRTSNRSLVIGALALGAAVAGSAVFLVSYLRTQATATDDVRNVRPSSAPSMGDAPVSSATSTAIAALSADPTSAPTASVDKPSASAQAPEPAPTPDAGPIETAPKTSATTTPPPPPKSSAPKKTKTDYLQKR